jgi:transposase
MSKGYRRVDRGQPFLLPPDMREWLPEDHLVWFVLEVVDQLDTAQFHARARLGGVGREGYDPDLLLGLLLYGYCHGVRSSRQIERLCHTDVAFRVLCAQDVPDHTTIARFRQDHQDAVIGLFDQVLLLCARAGMGRFGTVAIDGTKIAANASPQANRRASALRRMAEQIVAEAAAVDAAEDAQFGVDARGDELPATFRDRSGRAGRIRSALDELAAEQAHRDAAHRGPRVAKAAERVERAQAAVEAEREQLQAEQADRQAREQAAAAAGRTLPGTRPVPPEQHSRLRTRLVVLDRARRRLATAAQAGAPQPATEAVGNLTDPQSRLMPTRGGWVQGYNCQLAVTGDGLIVAATVTQCPADTAEFIPMMHAAITAADTIHCATGNADAVIGTVLGDAGYASEDNFSAPGPDRLIAVGKRRDLERHAAADLGDPPAPDASAREHMAYRLSTPKGIALYRRRAATVEPVHGILKDRRGLRRFSRRGKTAALSELLTAALATNLVKLHTTRTAATIA